MKNMLLDHMETTLKFSYPLCTVITEYETLPVSEVEVQCTLLYSGELMIEYRLRIDGIDSIPLHCPCICSTTTLCVAETTVL